MLKFVDKKIKSIICIKFSQKNYIKILNSDASAALVKAMRKLMSSCYDKCILQPKSPMQSAICLIYYK
ncbi:hypothetical protein BpHYR1_018891 [Brachionus plicatilis]|uniref:Uncharacterized protein n=1 Tax=Brachionus plicatilis TaxID=10195 RepID=A0A3M7R5U0_BRAPC|nr:hypothetical protein BpHYR1_018891 [Brachionus plicatilis]